MSCFRPRAGRLAVNCLAALPPELIAFLAQLPAITDLKAPSKTSSHCFHEIIYLILHLALDARLTPVAQDQRRIVISAGEVFDPPFTPMSTNPNYFDGLPPELVALFAPSLSLASLNAFTQTCRRLHGILQPVLDERFTRDVARSVLYWAAESNRLNIVKRVLGSFSLSDVHVNDFILIGLTPLHAAAKAGNVEITRLLLEAGANPAVRGDQEEYQPLHLAARNQDLPMMTLLLDHGAPVDAFFSSEDYSENSLQTACLHGNIDMVNLLLDRGANIDRGRPLAIAVRTWNADLVRLLLERGANARVLVSFPIRPFSPSTFSSAVTERVGLLYPALGLRAPGAELLRLWRVERTKNERLGGYGPQAQWSGPSEELRGKQRRIMSLLLKHGASKDGAMDAVRRHLRPLAEEAGRTEEEFLEIVEGVFRVAEQDSELATPPAEE